MALSIVSVFIFVIGACRAQFPSETACVRNFAGRCAFACDNNRELNLGVAHCSPGGQLTCCSRRFSCEEAGGVCQASCIREQRLVTGNIVCPRPTQVCCTSSFRPRPTPPIPPSPPVGNLPISVRQGECGRSSVVIPRIINGWRTGECNWPWMAALKTRFSDIFCAGVLVNHNTVLTVAHCLRGVNANDLEVVLGEYDPFVVDRRQVTHAVLNFEINDQFTSNSPGSNIAVIKLRQSADFNDCVAPACLHDPTIPLRPGARCYIAGWGLSQEGVPSVLRGADVTLMDHRICQTVIWLATGTLEPLKDDLVCTNSDFDYNDACNNDDGGMLVCPDDQGRWSLVGLIAYYTCNFELPTLYTNITFHADWILDRMRF